MPKRRNHGEISERVVKRRVLDRISDLPDEILLHILSFLPNTTERARTSLISRRWRHIWTHDPSIKFIFAHVDPLTDIDAAAHNYVAAVDSCLRSVNALAIDLFSIDLWLPTPSPPAEIRANSRVADRWFRFAGNRSVRRLSVKARTRPGTWSGNCRIPSSIFCCRALTELDVSFSAFPAVPSNFRGFRFLKTLSIGCGTIDNETVADLLPCCPLLESLSLIGCGNLDYVQVSPKDLPNLKRLILFSNMSITASIEAPNLEFFNFKGELQELHWTGSKALREAIIRDNGDDEITPDTKDDWMNLVLAVSGVRVLTINHWFCQFVIPEQNMFKNLKELNCFFDWITGSMLHTFISNLKECLMLEKLYIKLNYETRSHVKDAIKESCCKTQAAIDDFILPKNVFLKIVEDNFEDDGFEFPEHFLQLTLPLHHLRTVTLEEFVGSKYEMFLVKFLLRSAVSLEEFIVFDYLGRDEVRTEEELQLLFAPIPKASSCVQMKLTLMDTWKLPRLLK